MADVKWIKIVTDIFDDEKILLIESMPDADAIIVIWFKLLCLAGKQNNGGVFLLNDRIAYTDEMFATIFRRKVNTVRMALQTFQQYGMIEIVDHVVTIPNWSKHQSLDAYERRKERDREYQQRRYHERKALLLAESSSDTSTEKSSDISPDASSDLGSLDKDKEEDKDKNKRDIGASASKKASGAHAFKPPTLEQVQAYAQEKGYSRQEFNPEKFVTFYTSKGWKVGKDKMKDWKAAVRGWVVRYRDEHGQRSTSTDYSGEWNPETDW